MCLLWAVDGRLSPKFFKRRRRVAATTPKPGVVQFGALVLDLKAGELRKQGVRVKLQEQPFLLLTVLIEHAGDVVTKEELRQRIWPADTFVDFDHGLHSAITRLREALGDSSESPRFIETLPRRGYRFIAPVQTIGDRIETETPPQQSPALEISEAQEVSKLSRDRLGRFGVSLLAGLLGATLLLALLIAADIGGARRWLLRSSNPTIRSIAVLPLQNASGDPEQEYFADGMTDALITNLSQIDGLQIISHTSAMHYKATKQSLPQIGRELNVDGVVQGAVVRSGDRVRITAQLVHASSEQDLWTGSYERDAGDILRLQREVAQEVAQQVRMQLTPKPEGQAGSIDRVNPEAYEAYLRGRYFWNQRTESGLLKSIEQFQHAIDLDPNSALPYAGLADAYLVFDAWTVEAASHAEIDAKASAAVAKALQLDPAMAEAHTVLAGLKHGRWDWSGAEAEYRRAIELNPNYAHAHQWYSQLLCELGRFDEGLAEAQRAHSLDPLNLILAADIGNRLYWARRYSDAIAPLQKTLELDSNFAVAHRFLGQVYEQNGTFEAALSELKRAAELSSNNPIDLGALGHTYAMSEQRKQASEILQQLQRLSAKRHVSGYHFALIYAGLGDKENALHWLEEAYREHSTWILHLKVDPRLDPLRSDPRFQDLLRRVGLGQ